MCKKWFVMLTVLMVWFVSMPLVWAEKGALKERSLVQVERRITDMNAVLKKLYQEISRAKEKNDLHRVNCLLTKLNLVKGLLKASDRSKAVLLEAFYGNDTATARVYKAKVDSYADSAKEIERSMEECRGVRKVGEGTTLVYIRPEGGTELQPTEANPWDRGFVPGADGYPAVPPASPYR